MMRFRVAMQIDRPLTDEELSALNALAHLTAHNDIACGRGDVQAQVEAASISDAGIAVGDEIRAVIGEGHISAHNARVLRKVLAAPSAPEPT